MHTLAIRSLYIWVFHLDLPPLLFNRGIKQSIPGFSGDRYFRDPTTNYSCGFRLWAFFISVQKSWTLVITPGSVSPPPKTPTRGSGSRDLSPYDYVIPVSSENSLRTLLFVKKFLLTQPLSNVLWSTQERFRDRDTPPPSHTYLRFPLK